MTRFVKNDGGTIHSVPDDFDLPEGWEEAKEGDASAELLGTAADPAVAAVELHDGPDAVPAEAPLEVGADTGIADPETGFADAEVTA